MRAPGRRQQQQPLNQQQHNVLATSSTTSGIIGQNSRHKEFQSSAAPHVRPTNQESCAAEVYAQHGSCGNYQHWPQPYPSHQRETADGSGRPWPHYFMLPPPPQPPPPPPPPAFPVPPACDHTGLASHGKSAIALLSEHQLCILLFCMLADLLALMCTMEQVPMLSGSGSTYTITTAQQSCCYSRLQPKLMLQHALNNPSFKYMASVSCCLQLAAFVGRA